MTLAEIARRAGVSRPTVYRRWPDTRSILAALLTSRITDALDDVPGRGVGREAVVERIVAVAGRLRHDDVVMAVLHQAPELAMVYIAERLGTSQQILIDALAGDLKSGPGRRQRARGRLRAAGGDGPADHPVDDPVGPDRRARSSTPTRWPPNSPTR